MKFKGAILGIAGIAVAENQGNSRFLRWQSLFSAPTQKEGVRLRPSARASVNGAKWIGASYTSTSKGRFMG